MEEVQHWSRNRWLDNRDQEVRLGPSVKELWRPIQQAAALHRAPERSKTQTVCTLPWASAFVTPPDPHVALN